MTPRDADVIVVGGGLMGAATAFFLRRRGRSVVVLERDRVGQHASGTNFGNVRRQGRFLPQLPLANRAREIWGRLPELIGEDVEFLPTGHLRLACTPEEVGRMEAYARDCRPYGLDLELMSANALRVRFPYLGREAVAGSFSPHDGHANPRLAAPAFARAARRLGATIVEGAEVAAIEKAGEDFSVETADGRRYRAPVVQICAGAWGGQLSARFGEPVPLTPRGPQMGVTEPVPYAVKPVVGVWAEGEAGIYFRQVARGNVVFGGGVWGEVDMVRRRAALDPVSTLGQLPHLRRAMPAFGQLAVIRTWSGIEGYVADRLPVMGASATTPGLYYAFGFSGHGFQLGPAVGEVMAELIDRGRSAVPIDPFGIARFRDAV
ncbi:NAD(P)/FAD-dependent oxidoreductase [Methylobacterium oryzihabitans]|uniref:FAD-binding oxidoreductase n=1 Tax=Methylobacterium oryzihabitans TaxID=2499852 RepID=A0A437P9Z6_9HYPH|nr:FAD-binding oxidoreductase [Methylobacterium oryzihabitans]RVU19099.1 FAD-binding oxidoreductase [Methylobacterium oryzihabitans]